MFCLREIKTAFEAYDTVENYATGAIKKEKAYIDAKSKGRGYFRAGINSLVPVQNYSKICCVYFLKNITAGELEKGRVFLDSMHAREVELRNNVVREATSLAKEYLNSKPGHEEERLPSGKLISKFEPTNVTYTDNGIAVVYKPLNETVTVPFEFLTSVKLGQQQ